MERIIQACSGVECRLLIIGKLNEKQLALLDKERIKYTNKKNLTNKEVYECYVQADMLCFPSLYEGFGMPIIEAQATGRVVITSNIRPMSDVAGEGAFFVNPYSVDEIRNAIVSLSSNKKMREKLIDNGLKNCLDYTSEKIAHSYCELYASLLKKG